MASSVAVLAGALSTAMFAVSTMPMIVKALRTRDLSSYSGGNLILSNVGNLFYAVYVLSLPIGPAWALYGFNLVVSATMLALWVSYKVTHARSTERSTSTGSRRFA
ncbi:hypothetical protein GCM10009836_18760 [Pseudonocardia ailaonensis]|uniref:PQ-loop repeat-containing protein n=1 Tax=Pseudonocardia ailaonensis TaxID=367279 RepID=A0ABN2MVY2_9PSEU